MRGLRRVLGAEGLRVVRDLRGISPGLARLLAEFPFADIYARRGLPLRTRELCAIAALAALGHPRAQLQMHVHGALNVGCTPAEITEVILQTTVFAGFPAALNGMAVVREVFAQRVRPAGRPRRSTLRKS